MRRRQVITAIAGAAWAWQLGARAQQPRTPRIGVLALGNPDPEPFWKALRDGLRELGHVEEESIAFDFRSAEGKSDLLPGLAAEMVRAKVDIIVAYQTPAATAAKQATRDIPVVMAGVGDPVATGLVASLARPGGNVTGSSGVVAELAGKNLEALREMLPSVRRVGVLASTTDPFTKPFLEQLELAARNTGVETTPIMVHPAAEFEPAFAQMEREGFEAVIIMATLLRPSTIDLTLKHRLPSISPIKVFAEAGGLMSYSGNLAETFHEAAVYVDAILKGARPGDLPVRQPTKFELVINARTARALGLTVPPSLLARADEVIE
jgi:putative tryptophan/tyrosine transport system substrate-binding protein